MSAPCSHRASSPQGGQILPSEDAGWAGALQAYVRDAAFPCVGAKSALNAGRMAFGRYGSLAESGDQISALCEALDGFSKAHPAPGDMPVSYMAVFDNDVEDEPAFERRMWTHLQALHEHDRKDHDWAAGVSSDASSASFSFSISGRAFFVVGLHPHASRMARQAPMPCLVFNFHDQFEQLRASGKYAKMQAVIRARDVALQGHLNPVLSRFGEASEARQYAGREVDADWHCPFHTGS